MAELAEALSGVNGKILRWAREFYNMDAEEAAKAIGIDVERYNSWENGTDYPTYAKLRKISEVFRKPSAIFFFPTPPELPCIKGDLRTLPDDVVNRLSKNVIMQFEKAKVYQMSLKELYGDADAILRHKELFPNDIHALCDYFRTTLSFPISAQKARKSTKVVFEIYRERFYDIGIYVFKESFKDNSISGLCINDLQFPVIMINNSMSFARQIFTLFHELYHLISDTSGAEIIRDDYYVMLDKAQSDVEHACDSFANMFLVPLDDFQIELQKASLNEQGIAELAKLYSVSREAIMYKLWKLGRITSDEYTTLKESFYGEAIREKKEKKDGSSGGGNYYSTKLSYLGQRYTGEVFKQYFSGKIDNIRASAMLQSKIDHLPRLETAYFRGTD